MGICGNDFDDDAYYADLEKWILKLTAEDDDEKDCAVALGADRYGSGRNGSLAVDRRPSMAEAYALDCWGSFKKGGNGGTGVFIPRIDDRRPTNPGQGAKNEKGRDRRCRGIGSQVRRRGHQHQNLPFVDRNYCLYFRN